MWDGWTVHCIWETDVCERRVGSLLLFSALFSTPKKFVDPARLFECRLVWLQGCVSRVVGSVLEGPGGVLRRVLGLGGGSCGVLGSSWGPFGGSWEAFWRVCGATWRQDGREKRQDGQKGRLGQSVERQFTGKLGPEGTKLGSKRSQSRTKK